MFLGLYTVYVLNSFNRGTSTSPTRVKIGTVGIDTQFHPSRTCGENLISFNRHNQQRDGVDGIHFVFPHDAMAQDAHLGHAQPTAHPKASGDTLRSQ